MRRIVLCSPLLIAMAGCSSSDNPVIVAPPPKYNVEEVTSAIFAEYDKNKDGVIDKKESEACPALYLAFREIDTNKDQKLSTEEIRNRVTAWANLSTGSVQVNCVVKQFNSEPLADATVTFEPERCMGAGLKPATARTDAKGFCDEWQIDGKTYRGLPGGLYRIRVTKDGMAIPAQFNHQSVLGREVYFNQRAPTVSVNIRLSP
jgi:hypothetical protein